MCFNKNRLIAENVFEEKYFSKKDILTLAYNHIKVTVCNSKLDLSLEAKRSSKVCITK